MREGELSCRQAIGGSRADRGSRRDAALCGTNSEPEGIPEISNIQVRFRSLSESTFSSVSFDLQQEISLQKTHLSPTQEPALKPLLP
jgi:hypothetical protein